MDHCCTQVNLRRREMAVRLAVGAQRADILRLILWRAAILLLIGVAAGTALSYATGRFLRSYLYKGELYTLLPAGTCQLFVRDPGSYRLPQQRIDPVERMNLHVPLVEPERELVYIAL